MNLVNTAAYGKLIDSFRDLSLYFCYLMHSITSSGIEINEQFRKALDLMEETERPVFITGKAGTGKSTLLDYFRNHTKKRVVVLAPTGVSAINVRGQTIHSFFRFHPGITLGAVRKIRGANADLYKQIDAIVIDEVSMVRADLMDCIDAFLRVHVDRKKPFGGVQMIFFGDLYQLPPVVSTKEKEFFSSHYESPYFFDAVVMKQISMELIELEKMYRQKDERFVSVLNAIRNNTATEAELSLLNQRFDPEFIPNPDDFYICLTSLNTAAEQVNRQYLARIPAPLRIFHGTITEDFTVDALPTRLDLQVKVGAQVMLLNNDGRCRWVNGSIGKIIDIVEEKHDDDRIIVELITGQRVDVSPYSWELFEYYFDKGKNVIDSRLVGSFTQYPIKLAWAVTIHKSQGKTFDRVVIDIGRGTFTSGQVYVALSRCTRLDGIVLKRPIEKKHIFVDWRVVRFMTRFQYRLSERDLPLEEKVDFIRRSIENRRMIEIVYLKHSDVKSRRRVLPLFVGNLAYGDSTYLGMEAFCHLRNDRRVFRVDRILEIKEIEGV